MAALYDYKESRTATSEVSPTLGMPVIDGEFTNASALLITVGMNYKF